MPSKFKNLLNKRPSLVYVIVSDVLKKDVCSIPLSWIDYDAKTFQYPADVRNMKKLMNLKMEGCAPLNDWPVYGLEIIFSETGEPFDTITHFIGKQKSRNTGLFPKCLFFSRRFQKIGWLGRRSYLYCSQQRFWVILYSCGIITLLKIEGFLVLHLLWDVMNMEGNNANRCLASYAATTICVKIVRNVF